MLVAEGDLGGRRVLDVGCGTGRLLEHLVRAHGARAWGVDPTPEMLAVARRRVPRGVGLKRGRAEQLPFRDASFERVTMTLVVHLVERDRALGETHRVLAPGGRLVLATFDPEHFAAFWLNRFFPSARALDEARFPTAAELEHNLAAAGYAEAHVRRVSQRETIGRAEALEKVRGRHISTFQLLTPEEYAAGLARAERELSAEVDVRYEHLVVTGLR